jgi:glycosyl hydrolase family 30
MPHQKTWPGDTLATTTVGEPTRPDGRVHAQGFVTPDGTRKLLIVNKTANPVEVSLEADSDPITIDGYATSVIPRAVSAERSALASS